MRLPICDLCPGGSARSTVRRLPAVLAAAAAVGLAARADAATIANDGFETSTHPTGFRTVAVAAPTPGNNGIPFYNVKSGGTISLVNDAAVGGVAPATLTVTDTTANTNTAVVGNLPLIGTLTNVNDNVTLSFRFRFLNQGTATASNANFRFGLMSSAGTAVTGDNQTSTSDNDQGYYVQIGDTAQATNNLFYNEAGGQTTILSGNDRTNIASSTGVSGIADNLGHSVVFSLTRTSSTAIGLSLSIDGGTAVTASTTTNLRTAFDEVAFSNAFVATSMNYAIDDVQVTATSFAVPEPGAASALLVGAVGLLARRRAR